MNEASDGTCGPVRVTAWVRGRVQGVGFRWWVRCNALSLGLTGWAGNRPDGRVEIVAEGTRRDCARLLDLLAPDAAVDAAPAPAPGGHDTERGIPGGGDGGRRPGHVSGTSHLWSRARGREGFVVR